MTNTAETLGYALILAFLWFIWPPLVLLGAGALLVTWANTRTRQGRFGKSLGAAVAAARRAYATNVDDQPTTELRRIA